MNGSEAVQAIQEYAKGKLRYLTEKAVGLHQDIKNNLLVNYVPPVDRSDDIERAMSNIYMMTELINAETTGIDDMETLITILDPEYGKFIDLDDARDARDDLEGDYEALYEKLRASDPSDSPDEPEDISTYTTQISSLSEIASESPELRDIKNRLDKEFTGADALLKEYDTYLNHASKVGTEIKGSQDVYIELMNAASFIFDKACSIGEAFPDAVDELKGITEDGSGRQLAATDTLCKVYNYECKMLDIMKATKKDISRFGDLIKWEKEKTEVHNE